MLYSAEGSAPGYCGVKLAELVEGANIRVSNLLFVPSDEQFAEAQARVDALPEAIRMVAPPVDVYVVWSTS